MRRLFLLLVAVALAAPVAAQVATPVLPTSVDVLILASGSLDPATAPALAQRNTPIAAGGPMCGLPAAVGAAVTTNPTLVEFDDPFVGGGLKCRAAIPVGLPNGVGYRAVAVAHGVCNGVPCASARSLVGVPVFPISGTQASPAVPTGVVVRP